MVLDWVLNPRPPALEASSLPLSYRGSGTMLLISIFFNLDFMLQLVGAVMIGTGVWAFIEKNKYYYQDIEVSYHNTYIVMSCGRGRNGCLYYHKERKK